MNKPILATVPNFRTVPFYDMKIFKYLISWNGQGGLYDTPIKFNTGS